MTIFIVLCFCLLSIDVLLCYIGTGACACTRSLGSAVHAASAALAEERRSRREEGRGFEERRVEDRRRQEEATAEFSSQLLDIAS